MTTVLHGVPISQPVRAVLFAAAYKGLALELKPTMPGRKGPKGTKSADLEFSVFLSISSHCFSSYQGMLLFFEKAQTPPGFT